jgi:hypothetical protein
MERMKGDRAGRHAFVDVATRRRLRAKGSVFAFAPTAISMYLGQWVKTLIFLPFDTTEMAEAAVFLFFPYFHEG